MPSSHPDPDDDPVATAQAEIHSEFNLTLDALVDHWSRLNDLANAYSRLVLYTKKSRDAILDACRELTGDPDFDPSEHADELIERLKMPR